MARRDEFREFSGEVVTRTDLAVLFLVEEVDEEIWFPLSICELSDDESSILAPAWFCEKKGL